jgi:hypothetical protein
MSRAQLPVYPEYMRIDLINAKTSKLVLFFYTAFYFAQNLSSLLCMHSKTHATPAMTDVIHKQCAHFDCTVNPSYGLEWKTPTHCIAKHMQIHQ